MKVLYCLKVFPKLSERFILDEITELLKKGVEVYIFALMNPGESIVHEEISKLNILEKVTYFNKSSLTEKFRILASNRNLARCIIIPDEFKKVNLSHSLLFKKALNLLNLKPDLIHAHFADAATSLSMYLSSAIEVPYTFTAHAYGIFEQSRIAPILFKEKIRRAKGIVAISNYNKRYLQRYCKKSEKIQVIHCGVNLNRFKLGSRKSASDELFNILSICRLTEKKGIDDLIKAASLLVKEFPNIRIRIVGTGPQENELRNLAKILKVEANIEFLGNVPNRQLIDLYHRSNLFVLPCKIARSGDRDGIPVTIMEAMAMKLPVISTRVSGIPELVKNGYSGMLIPPKDFQELARTIKYLIGNESICKKMGDMGRKTIIKEFNIQKNTAKLVNFFKNNLN